MATNDAFVVSCEHGGNTIPAPYRALFREHQALLLTHRGYDLGALLLASELSDAMGAPLVSSTISRLLVDLNRSIGHPRLFSEATRSLPAAVREDILAKHYRPYRSKMESLVGQVVARGGRVIHIASHSFTPELHGKVREADVGLLYDPGRPAEVALCRGWQAGLALQDARLRVRRNYPYAGKSDGLPSYLRSRFSSQQYVGVELEVNQRIVVANGEQWFALRALLISALRAAWAAELVH
jgi:predicted N-formylglutamate amidohydrolase